MWIWFVLLIACVWVSSPLVSLWLRRRLLYRKHIEPVLAKNGYQLRSIHVSPWLDREPFPKLQFLSSGLVSRIPVGGYSEYQEYRIVQVQDPSGRPATIWFELQFASFIFINVKLVDIKWKKIES